MITYIDNLFLTEKAEKKVDKIKKDIDEKRFISLACLITLSNNETDVFEILPVVNLKIKSSAYDNMTVIGIAENKKAAIRLCAHMSMVYLQSKADVSMREYFKSYVR